MFELTVSVERVIHHRDCTNPQYGKICYDTGYQVGQKDRHGIASFDAEIEEARCNSVHHFLELTIGQFVPLKCKCCLIGKLFRCPIQDIRHAYLFVTDYIRDSLFIELQPWFVLVPDLFSHMHALLFLLSVF